MKTEKNKNTPVSSLQAISQTSVLPNGSIENNSTQGLMKQLNLLLLEDEPMDAYLVKKVLERSGIQFSMKVIATKDEFNECISQDNYDLIIADQSLPQFNAMEAFSIARSRNLLIPFILITGSVSEEFAVSAIKQGISDYILKDRLQRLPSALLNAIEKYTVEQQKLRSEANLRTLFDNTDIGYVLLDPSQCIVSYNAPAARFTLEHLHKPLEDGRCATEYFTPEQQPGIVRAINSALDGVSKEYQLSFDLNGRDIWFHTRYLPVRDDSRKVIGVCLSVTDITDKKNLELQEQKITADLMERNKDLEQFAYIISHNLRAPVANITDISHIILSGELDDNEREEFMKGLNTAIKKLDGVIIDLNNILQVKYKVNQNKEMVYFTDLVTDIKASISNYLDKTEVDIRSDFAEIDGLTTLKSYLYSIFYNLISNSIKYRQPSVPPVIEITSRKLNNKLELTFRDNSMGIDIEKKGDQVFGLYKRFHPTSAEGKGLGLYMVKTQVETLGGKISVKSQVNKGTEFKIVLPIA